MVQLQPHRPEWARAFRVEAARLAAALAHRIDAVEHVGSTAVPALLAKPIIDLAHILHVFRADQWAHCNQRLFRDKLLHDPAARRRYRHLKASLAGLTDGRDYTAAKRSLIEELLNEERAARGLPPTTAWEK